LIDRVSGYERTGITAYYYRATGELDKEIDAYQLGVRDYPQNWGFHNQLSVIYIDEGRYEEGLKEGLEAVRLEADVEPPYRRMLDSYICLNRRSQASSRESTGAGDRWIEDSLTLSRISLRRR
jgi:eukaryotic-like serine/threonine-protein kinase